MNSHQKDFIQWEKIDTNSFAIFLRDLSLSTNTNLKHMIEDLDKETEKDKNKKKKMKNGKKRKQIIKKKDLIIQEQNKKRQLKNEEEDISTIEFMMKNIDTVNPYLNLKKLKTEKGQLIYKCKLLETFWNEMRKKVNTNSPHVFNLYFDLMNYKKDLELEYQELLKKIEKVLSDYDAKSYMLENLGHLMPPLDHWSIPKMNLDAWQKDVIHKVRHKTSVIVKAPTSSGKTFIAMATGIIHKRILYVCPAKPVAYQVGANFVKMGYKVHFLIENHSYQSYDSKTNIFVGTPDIIEESLPKIITKDRFDYAVYDEIHNLNNDTGKAYENILKLIDCPFLALSATIENIDFLKDLFQKIHPKKNIDLVTYEKRFMNQQRWIFKQDTITKLHPCSCFDLSDFITFQNISFTPNDCFTLYEVLEEEFDDSSEEEDLLDDIEPDNYFVENKMITLDEVKTYEIKLKNKLEVLYQNYPDRVKNIVSSLKNDISITDNSLETLVPLLDECKVKDMLPLIYFHTNDIKAKEIFIYLFHTLQKEEELNYPFHYQILEKKNTLYQAFKEKRDAYKDSLKLKSKTNDARTNDARTYIESKLEVFQTSERDTYNARMIDYYESCLQKCNGTENEVKKRKNLKKEMNEFIKNPDFREQDIFQKHHKYCFTRGEPMSGLEIKSIRREIKQSTGETISYESPIFQLLKRGIGLYIQSMPDVYNWILQRLMSQRKLGIVISDRTLCLGIDLPIRSVVLSGFNNPIYTKEDYLQMSGRAGRRGHDNRGNIIFHNIPNYIELMRGSLPKLVGSEKKIYDSYSVLSQLNSHVNLNPMTEITFNSRSPVIQDRNNDMIHYNRKFQKILWSLRYYELGEEWMKSFHKMEKNLFMENEENREIYVLKNIFHLMNKNSEEFIVIYKRHRIDENHEEILNIFYELGNIIKTLCNTLDNTHSKITREICKKIFLRCQSLIFKYRYLDE